ncbi:Hypothetical predicted protein [Pelobates cultripes]|uniref:Uncharacterized protein n=1 Tax=Pelobates cultripes TaxID=61616 RepID=A0AAD1S0J0_PELCU|nr:Hypothetical predicted protein [Pelobates cultripes]
MTTNESLDPPTSYKDNLTLAERRALIELSRESNLVIKSSDKGGNIVLMDKANYIEMCMEHLENTDMYRRLPTDPTTEYLTELKSILEIAEIEGIISND